MFCKGEVVGLRVVKCQRCWGGKMWMSGEKGEKMMIVEEGGRGSGYVMVWEKCGSGCEIGGFFGFLVGDRGRGCGDGGSDF